MQLYISFIQFQQNSTLTSTNVTMLLKIVVN